MDMRTRIEPLHVVERRCIMDAMEQCNWRVRDAAEELQIGNATLYRRLHEYTGGDLKKLRALAKQQYREADDAKYGWSKMQKPPGGALRHRRRVEATIQTRTRRTRAGMGAMIISRTLMDARHRQQRESMMMPEQVV